jgi:hypothetical protein
MAGGSAADRWQVAAYGFFSAAAAMCEQYAGVSGPGGQTVAQKALASVDLPIAVIDQS